MTVEEARRRAQDLGVDLSNPDRAAERARELGVPEAKIQQLLDAVQREQASEEALEEVSPEELTEEPAEEEVEEETEEEVEEGEPAEEERAQKPALSYFGYNTFRNVPEAFRPTSIGSIDEGYLIEPGDELRLTVWGAAEFRYDLPVDREGRIYVKNVGQRMVAGERLSELREGMKQWLSKNYAGLTADPPTVMMDLTVTRIRPVKVFVLGELAQPGGYTLSGNATVFHALYAVGGPLTRGSLRNIKVIHDTGGNLSESYVDMYNHLLKGYEPNEVHLRDNDRIFISPRGKTVAITGAVKRPARYELKEGETVKDLLEFAGGLVPEAYTKRFQIERIIPFDERTRPSVARKVLDLPLTKILSGELRVKLADGDKVRILSILDMYQNPVAVGGAVYQPGRYELSDSVRTVEDLILEADSVMGDAYLKKADLVRINEDGTERLITLDLTKVFSGDPRHDIPLLPFDSLRVYSVHELEMPKWGSIRGHVRTPDTVRIRDEMTVYDLLFEAGGLLDEEFKKTVYLARADLLRYTPDGEKEEVIPFHLGKALREEGVADTLLRHRDEIVIYPRELDETVTEEFVTISGTVKNPGQYRLQDNMTLEDAIVRAGGFSEGADMKKVEVSRIAANSAREKENQKTVEFNVPFAEKENPGASFALDDPPGISIEARTFSLKHRDRIYVRTDPEYQLQETVEVSGEVFYPGEYSLSHEGETLTELIARAGGVRPTGYPKGGRLWRNDTQVITQMDQALSGRSQADVTLLPGDRIIIPPEPNTVAVRGNVANEGLVKYEPNRHVSYYLNQAGGVEERTKEVLLTQANGATYDLKRWFLLPDRNPKVEDGAVILVTQKEEREEVEFDLGKTITNTTSVILTALTIIVLTRRAGF